MFEQHEFEEHGLAIAKHIADLWNLYKDNGDYSQRGLVLVNNAKMVGETFCEYSLSTVKDALNRLWKFGKCKSSPNPAQILAELSGGEKLGPRDPTPDQLQRQHDFQEQQKKRLTTLRRFGFNRWQQEALKRFYYNGQTWKPAWDNFTTTIAQIDDEVLRSCCTQVEKWTGWPNPNNQLLDICKKELAEIEEIIATERVR